MKYIRIGNKLLVLFTYTSACANSTSVDVIITTCVVCFIYKCNMSRGIITVCLEARNVAATKNKSSIFPKSTAEFIFEPPSNKVSQ